MEKIRWYLRRLRVMSPREITHRIGEIALLQYLRLERQLRFRQEHAIDWQRFSFCTAVARQLPRLDVSFNPTAQEAQRILAGDWGALGFAWRWTSSAAIWRTAPDTGKLWPMEFFGSIPFRAGNPYGDARILWEPGRLQGLVSLALLCEHDASCHVQACDLLERVLESWTRDNPYLTGAHYLSAMECALRLIAVCHALDMMRGVLQEGAATWSRLLWLMASHALLIERRLSLHSSSGNHSIAECAGLIYAGVLFPEHPRASTWRNLGLTILPEQACRQVLPDGGGIEQALWYQLFIIDLLGMVEALLETRGEVVPPRISAAVARGRKFLREFGKDPAELPAIGDGDGGFALTSHLRLSFKSCEQSRLEVNTFPDSGYTICRPADSSAVRVLIDHGPLGMPPSYGHGHADALSIIVTASGANFLVDPGTYAYNRGAIWRHYFRSTRAHNTVTVDGLDQAVQEAAFMWSRPYDARLVASNGSQADVVARILMRHSGYRRINVVHWRAVLLKRNGLIVVWDRLEGEGEHEFELNWHLGLEPLSIGPGADELAFANKYRIVVQGGRSSLHKGEIDPPCGWQSHRYGAMTAITTLRVVWRGKGSHEFATSIAPNSTAVNLDSELSDLRSLQACLKNE
jgi:hypothetical protein